MAFVKLDCGILDSSLWVDTDARHIFITALLMAEPHELREPIPQIEVNTLKETGFIVPRGWYGFVRAAGTGIVRRTDIEMEKGLAALERCGNPDTSSKNPSHEGRRMVRINGGYIILNFDVYRQKDHTAAERSKRYREKNRQPFVRQILSRDGQRCGICGGPLSSLEATDSHLDHIIPLVCGGIHGDASNYQLAHAKCNNGKSGTSNPDQWRHQSMPTVTPLQSRRTAIVTQAEAEAEAEAELQNKESSSVKAGPSKRKVKCVDHEFIESLKPLYPGIEIDEEIRKMKAWFLTPRGTGKTLTQQRLVNWLNRAQPNGNGFSKHPERTQDYEGSKKTYQERYGNK